MARPDEIGDAGIRLIARGGAKALTHRAVDAEAGLPAGSTSYYARTRRDLLRVVTGRITAQLPADLGALDGAGTEAAPAPVDLPAAPVDLPADPGRAAHAPVADVAVAFLDRIAARHDAQLARSVLLFELRGDDELRRTLTAEDDVRRGLERVAASLLAAAGVPDARQHAPTFVALVDALLLHRVADAGPLDARSVLTAYLAGLAADGRTHQDGGPTTRR